MEKKGGIKKTQTKPVEIKQEKKIKTKNGLMRPFGVSTWHGFKIRRK